MPSELSQRICQGIPVRLSCKWEGPFRSYDHTISEFGKGEESSPYILAYALSSNNPRHCVERVNIPDCNSADLDTVRDNAPFIITDAEGNIVESEIRYKYPVCKDRNSF